MKRWLVYIAVLVTFAGCGNIQDTTLANSEPVNEGDLLSFSSETFTESEEYIVPIYTQKYEIVDLESYRYHSIANLNFPPVVIRNEGIKVDWEGKTLRIQTDDKEKELNLRDFVLSKLPPLRYDHERFFSIYLDYYDGFYQNDSHLFLIFGVYGASTYTASHMVCINLETLEFEDFLITMEGIGLWDVACDKNSMYFYGSTFRSNLEVCVVNIDTMQVEYEHTYNYAATVSAVDAVGSAAIITLDRDYDSYKTLDIYKEKLKSIVPGEVPKPEILRIVAPPLYTGVMEYVKFETEYKVFRHEWNGESYAVDDVFSKENLKELYDSPPIVEYEPSLGHCLTEIFIDFGDYRPKDIQITQCVIDCKDGQYIKSDEVGIVPEIIQRDKEGYSFRIHAILHEKGIEETDKLYGISIRPTWDNNVCEYVFLLKPVIVVEP